MVVELMGLPGAGKSYLGSEMENELTRRNVRSISVVERSRSQIGWKVIDKALHLILPIMPSYRHHKRELTQILAQFLNTRPLYNEPTVLISYYIDQVVFLHYLYLKLRSRKNVFIFDEGIAQQLVNTIVNYQLDENSIKRIISTFCAIPQTIYVTTSIENVKKSIQKRNRHVCYIDELQGNDLECFLFSYKYGCDLIESIVHPILIERGSNIADIVDAVVRRTK